MFKTRTSSNNQFRSPKSMPFDPGIPNFYQLNMLCDNYAGATAGQANTANMYIWPPVFWYTDYNGKQKNKFF